MRKLVFIIVIAVGIYSWAVNERLIDSGGFATGQTDSSLIATAFRNHRSDVQIEGTGKVIHILPDDNDGSRHQRFLLRVNSDQTVLVAHNIDLAPRIDSLQKGDAVEFFGEYEWNPKGGVIHWTHRDPGGRHADGWLRHKDRTYD